MVWFCRCTGPINAVVCPGSATKLMPLSTGFQRLGMCGLLRGIPLGPGPWLLVFRLGWVAYARLSLYSFMRPADTAARGAMMNIILNIRNDIMACMAYCINAANMLPIAMVSGAYLLRAKPYYGY